jgi:hypothetical protein
LHDLQSRAILISSAGVKHPAQNTSLSHRFFFSMEIKVQSSAVENIEVLNDQVLVTFTGGRKYTYNSENLNQFLANLTDTITKGGSVGRLINSSIKSNDLVLA